MSEFINTADVIGDDEMCDQIIMRTVTEYKEERVTKIGDYAFYDCTALEKVVAPNATEVGRYVFSKCSSLEYIELPNVTSIAENSFSGIENDGTTYNDITLRLPNVTLIPRSAFSYSNVRVVDLRDVTLISSYSFVKCYKLIAIIIRNTSGIPTTGLPGDVFQGLDTTKFFIYVPSALLADYQAATNWSVLADQFRALEDYTVDGTTTGELDETKIGSETT